MLKKIKQELSLIEKKWERILWIIAFLVIGGMLYMGTNRYGGFGGLIPRTNVQLSFEKYIPFWPWTIYIYYMMAVFLAFPIFVKKYEKLRMVVNGYWLVTFISTIIFFFFPTEMPRPDIGQHDGAIWALFYGLYSVDGPRNLFPSMHVSATTFALFANNRFFPRIKLLNYIMAISINLSTLSVKQHTILDVIGGTIVGIIAYWIIFNKKWWFTKKWRNLPF